MKAKTICILIAAAAVVGVQSARAGDKERYLIGGLLGGWILNEVLDEPHVVHHRSVEVVTHVPQPVYCPPVQYGYRRVRVWIPGHYERVVLRYGRVRTRWISGRYEVRTRRVRVSRPQRTRYERPVRTRRERYERRTYERDRFENQRPSRRRSH